MEKDKEQEELVNPKTDKRTEKATTRIPNPRPMKTIFDMKKEKVKKKTKLNRGKGKKEL